MRQNLSKQVKGENFEDRISNEKGGFRVRGENLERGEEFRIRREN